MTVANIIWLSASGILLLTGLISLFVSLAKKSVLFKKIAAGVVAVLGITACIICVINIVSVKKLTDRQNYVACELLELESYASGRDMAEMANERINNADSAKIISLSLGLAGQTETCADAAESFAKLYPEDDDFEDISKLSESVLKSEEPDYDEYRDELRSILKSVKKGIEPDDEDTAEEIAEALAALEMGDVDEAEDIAKDLEDDGVLTLQLRARVAAANGDYDEAYELMNKVVKKDNITSNKVALATAAANGGYNKSKDSFETKLYKNKIKSLKKEKKALEKKIDDANETDLPALESELSQINSQINSLEDTVENLHIIKAINYLTSLLTETDSTEILAALSELYYLMGDELKAEEYAARLFSANLTDDINERLTIDIVMIVGNNYDNGAQVRSGVLALVDKLHQNCVEYEYEEDSESFAETIINGFADFLESMINVSVNTVHISSVETVDLENFEVSVNISRENPDGSAYTKEDFAIYDMGIPVSDFTVSADSGQETSVCLVIDNSGSMSGSNIEQAKNAAAGFVNSADPNVSIGLVTFESSANLICSVTESTGTLTRNIYSIGTTGGTNMVSGLTLAVTELENRPGNKIIILLSDGADDYSSAGQMPQMISELKRKGITVYTVGMDGADAEYLSNIASSTGGQYFSARDSAKLEEMYSIINGLISNDYTITFKTASDSDSFERTVRIVMSDGYYDEIDYVVGPSQEEVQQIVNGIPQSDYYEQIGGSNRNGGGGVE